MPERTVPHGASDVMVRAESVSLGFDAARPFLSRLLSRGPRPRLRAVHEVSFRIRRGETFGLVGESGCGKTTVGRLLVGLYAPDSGRIEIRAGDEVGAGALSSGPPPIVAQMIFQDPYSSLDPRWRVAHIIAEPLQAQRLIADPAARRRRVDELLELVGLSSSDGAKFPHEFSGGQRQRIAIARALSTNPRFLVCDEPTSSLDVSVQAQILNLMKSLQAEFGLTYLFISHDLAVVAHMSNEIGVMYFGSLVEIAPARAIFNRPLHPYTRVLLDALPAPRSGNGRRETPRGSVPDPFSPLPGCAFHPRCTFATDCCRADKPELLGHPEGGLVACHHVDEVLRRAEGRAIPSAPERGQA